MKTKTKVQISAEMKRELAIAKKGYSEAEKILKEAAQGIADGIKTMIGENSPVPELREEVFAHTSQFAMEYLCGAVKKREMKGKYKNFYAGMIDAFMLHLLQEKGNNPFKDAMMRATYYKIRINSILNGETVSITKVA